MSPEPVRMYLLPTHVPIFLDGGRPLLTSGWKRSLLLLRDSLEGRLGPLVVVAPHRRAGEQPAEEELQPGDDEDGIEVVPAFPEACRARAFWARHRAGWLRDLAPLIEGADLVHAGLDDVFKPVSYSAFVAASRRGRPTVFVQDTDIVCQIDELARGGPLRGRARAAAYGCVYERWCRWGVARASLTLLKGEALMRRYGRFAANARCFQNTSHSTEDVVGEARLARRLATLEEDRPLRLAYCGRLVARKGLLRGLEVLARARALGARIELELVGEGEQRPALERAVERLGLGDAVRLAGRAPYGAALLRRLAEFDGLYFTPLAEDTPRMIFDGYASGLPLVAAAVPYVRERAAEDAAVWVLPRHDDEQAAARLLELDRRRGRLAALAWAARRAGQDHAAERWYRRRAEWTVEAYEAHRRLPARPLAPEPTSAGSSSPPRRR